MFMVKALKLVMAREQRQVDRCHRCGGLMVQEKVFELGSFDWRCVSCGERIDRVILAHRETHRSSKGLGREEAGKLLVGHGEAHLN
jgi:tRNA(Ile2) C34 agmatinyltransferase TiaS